MPCVIGMDMGSARLKAMMRCDGVVVSALDWPSGGNFAATAEKARQTLLAEAGLGAGAVDFILAAGYGSGAVSFSSEKRTDLTCHCAGIQALLPSVRTVIDVGDVSSKVFHVDQNGNLQNFIMSGKCAGGSGRVLPVIARVLQMKVEDIGDLSLRSNNRVDFNTGCLVFAESEAVSRIAEGVAKEDLLAGIHRALAAQLNSLSERIGIEPPLGLVGGGARNRGLVKALTEVTGMEIRVPADPHMTAALGAALLAAEKCASIPFVSISKDRPGFQNRVGLPLVNGRGIFQVP
jgi:(R)-2-hydroxyacyl-CoA dehydratese activating ATPase